MQDLKIRVNSADESKEAQELFFKLGYEWHGAGKSVSYLESSASGEFGYLVAWKPGCFSKYIIQTGCGSEDAKETTLPELRAMVNQDQDEPFLTPETTLNDRYAEIEEVRQAIKVKSGRDSDHTLDAMSFGLIGAGAASGGAKDNVNHPSHYADSAIECIDAMEAMMTPEQFIGYLRGNLFKYQWRYEKKNGIEDLKKAQWYLEKLTAKVAEKNAPF